MVIVNGSEVERMRKWYAYIEALVRLCWLKGRDHGVNTHKD